MHISSSNKDTAMFFVNGLPGQTSGVNYNKLTHVGSNVLFTIQTDGGPTGRPARDSSPHPHSFLSFSSPIYSRIILLRKVEPIDGSCYQGQRQTAASFPLSNAPLLCNYCSPFEAFPAHSYSGIPIPGPPRLETGVSTNPSGESAAISESRE